MINVLFILVVSLECFGRWLRELVRVFVLKVIYLGMKFEIFKFLVIVEFLVDFL